MLRHLPISVLLTIPVLSAGIMPVVNKSTGSPVTVNTEQFEITISPKGGAITRLAHKDPDPRKHLTDLASTGPLGFDIYTNSASLTALQNSDFQLSREENDRTIRVSAMIGLAGENGQSLTLIKNYTFWKKTHYWDFATEIRNNGKEPVALPELVFLPSLAIGPEGDKSSPRTAQTFYKFLNTPEKFETIYMESGGMSCSGDSKENRHIQGNVSFFGEASRFMTLVLQTHEPNRGAWYFPAVDNRKGQLHLYLNPVTIPAGGSWQSSFLVFSGPKTREALETSPEENTMYPELNKVHPDFYKAFDFGITAPIRDMIVTLLRWFHAVIPNYGISIILFAILFKLVFWPVNQKQAESMKKLQALQPMIQELNEKYKNNPQEKQKRMVALYRDQKVNPVAGCLPMLLQIPIFIALYSAFSDAYDLWRSPFIPGWIPDLSEPDTVAFLPAGIPFIGGFAIHILPLLMTLTQWLQTRLTVFTGDDSQKMIMQLMPLMMLFFFWSMPAGVVLYWTIQNLLSVAQQIYTNHKQKQA